MQGGRRSAAWLEPRGHPLVTALASLLVALTPVGAAAQQGEDESAARTDLFTETETETESATTEAIVEGATLPASAESENVVRRALEPETLDDGSEPAEAEPPPPPVEPLESDAPLLDERAPESAATTEADATTAKGHLVESRDALEGVEETAAEANIEIQLPAPCTGPWDWVQYSSGEWLRGEFKRMRKKQFEIQSTRFDRRETDWKHIRAFCFAGSARFILDDHTVLVGRGTLENGVLTVVSGDVTQTARRRDIWVILPGAPTEINRWRSEVSVGIDTSTGNTDSAGLTASAAIDREDPSTHFHVDYTGTFNRADGVTIAARHRVGQTMNMYFTRQFYATTPFVDYTSDRFQNLQNRVIPGLGLGYKIFDRDDLEWNIDGGLAYQYTQYVSVAVGEDLVEHDWGPRISSSFDWTIVSDLDLLVSQQTVILTRDFGQTSFHTQASLDYEITDLLFIELSFTHDRIRDPQESADGTVPEKDDFRYVFSLGLNFD